MRYQFCKIFQCNKLILLIALAMVLCIAPGYAQLSEKDLLNSLERADKQDYDSIYYELFKAAVGSETIEAKTYALKSLEMALKHANYYFVAKACRGVAYAYNKEGAIDSAKYYYYYGIDVAKKNKSERLLMDLSIDLGVLYDKQDAYDSALRFYNLALEIAYKIDAKDGQSSVQNNIGLVYYYLNNFEEALQHLQASLDIKRQNGFTDDIPSSLMNISVIYNEQGRYDDAIASLTEVEKICQNNCEIGVEATLNYHLGLSYLKKKDYDKSIPYLTKGYELAQKANIKSLLAYIPYHLSTLSYMADDNKGTLELLKESEQMADEINLKRLKRDIYEAYTKLYERTGNLEKVVEYQNKFMAIRDSIFNEQVAFNIAVLQLDAQKKQSDLVIQQKETELFRSQMIIVLVVIIAVLFVLVSWLLYKRSRLNKRLRHILEKQVKLRTSDLVQNNQELKQLNAEFETLLGQTSKYIRGPLATLMGLIDLVEKDQDDPQRTLEYLGKIKKVAGSMGLSLDQLKEVGKIREGNKKGSLGKPTSSTLEELLEAKH